MRDLTILGRTNWRGKNRPFGVPQADLRAHVYIIGKTGVGKSTLLEAMIRQDILRGAGVALLDPHGDLAERLRAWIPETRAEDLIYLDVPNLEQKIGFNPLANVPTLRRSLAANAVVDAFKKIFSESWGYRLEHIFRNAILLLLDQETATIAAVLRLLHEPEYLREALTRSTNEAVQRFWIREFEKYPGKFRAEAISPIENKLGSFLVDPFLTRVLVNCEATLDPRAVMDERKILLVNLAKGKIGENPAALFGSLLVSAIGVAGLARSDSTHRPDFHVYLDEFQTFTTLALAGMLSELRKFNCSLFLSHQFLDQTSQEVRNAVLGNAGTLVVFRVGASDASRLAKELGQDVEPDDLTMLPNRNFWIRPLVDGGVTRAFTGETITLN